MLLLGRTIYEIDLIKARDTGLQFYRTFSDAVVHFGDIPADCFARVVGHDQTILHERPSEAAPPIQADVRASGGRLPDKDQQQKRLDLIRSRVNFGFQSPDKEEKTK